MQATQIKGAKGAQWFGNHRLGSTIMALALIVVGTLAAVAAVRTIDDSDTPGNSQPVAALKAHYVAQAGEGLLGGTTQVESQLKAYHVPEGGEGRTGLGNLEDGFSVGTYDAGPLLKFYFPGFDVAELRTMSAADMAFLEDNVHLPGTQYGATIEPPLTIEPLVPMEHWRLLEMNELPADNLAPAPPAQIDEHGIGITEF